MPWMGNRKNSITRSFEFEEFMDGIDFVNNVGEIAEEAQHYPDITIKYTKVTLKLTTHDVGGVTDLDIELAQRVDNLVDWYDRVTQAWPEVIGGRTLHST